MSRTKLQMLARPPFQKASSSEELTATVSLKDGRTLKRRTSPARARSEVIGKSIQRTPISSQPLLHTSIVAAAASAHSPPLQIH